MNAQYSANTLPRLLNDSPAHIDFHIRSGDYFSFLATMLGYLEDALNEDMSAEEIARKCRLARELRNDLRYVQANYIIKPRALGDIEVIQPRGDLLHRRQTGA